MERYLAKNREGDRLYFDEEKAHHHFDVRRGKVGDLIEGSYEGKAYLAKIVSVDPFVALIEEEIKGQEGPRAELTLAFSLLRGSHHDLILQKGTELGVRCFRPFFSKRSVALVEKGEEKKKKERMERIVEMAIEQCHRTRVPEVREAVPFSKLLDEAKGYDLWLLADEGLLGSPDTLLKALESVEKKDPKVILVIGPEGGFERNEVKQALEKGFKPVSLGPSILRAETAALYGAALFSALHEGR